MKITANEKSEFNTLGGKTSRGRKTKSSNGGCLGFLVLIILIGGVIALYNLVFGNINYSGEIKVNKGDSFYKVISGLSKFDQLSYKVYLKMNSVDLSKIQPGTYNFDGSYSKGDFIEMVSKGPEIEYQDYKILEGWSNYDVDDYLSLKGVIDEGEYLEYVTNGENISKYVEQYEFLKQVNDSIVNGESVWGTDGYNDFGVLNSLEGFLYPDTYKIDISKSVLDQLVKLQLENFEQKIWQPNKENISSINDRLQNYGYKFKLNFYDILILASIIEKEERVDDNKYILGSVFLNRLQTGNRIDADISLCYGLNTGYEICTPAKIVEHLYDKSNKYNTRQNHGLTPTPISNVHISSVKAILEFIDSDYMFYLHDNNGIIHPAKNYGEHCKYKLQYLGRGC